MLKLPRGVSNRRHMQLPQELIVLLAQTENKTYKKDRFDKNDLTYIIVQELCESRGRRPGLSVLTSLLVSVDVKLY